MWLDQTDPCDTTLNVKRDDPRLLALGTVVAQWKEHVGVSVEKTVQEVIRAANAGATVAQLEAIFGWTGGNMTSLYTRSSDRRRLAREAMHKLANAK